MKYLTWRIAVPPKFDKIPEKPGIYIISTQQEIDHEYEIKYVGQSENLLRCVNQHWSREEKNKELRDHIAENYVMKLNYALVDSISDREGMLLYLYNYFNPPFNHGSPPDNEIVKCTVPAVRKIFN